MSKSPLSIFNLMDKYSYAPEFFKPFGTSDHAEIYNHKTFQTLAAVPLMFVVGDLLRRNMSSTEKDAESLRKTSKSTADATATMPDIDTEGAIKLAGDTTYSAVRITLPLVAGYIALMAGAKHADKSLENKAKNEFESDIKDKENEYTNTVMNKVYPQPSVKQAGIIGGMASAADSLGLLTWAAPVMAALAGGAFFATKHWADENSKARLKAKGLKSALEKTSRLDWVPKVELPGAQGAGVNLLNAPSKE